MTDVPHAAIDAAYAAAEACAPDLASDAERGELDEEYFRRALPSVADEILADAAPHIAVAERERICAWLDATADATTADTVRQAGGPEPLAAAYPSFIAASIASSLHAAANLIRNAEGTDRP